MLLLSEPFVPATPGGEWSLFEHKRCSFKLEFPEDGLGHVPFDESMDEEDTGFSQIMIVSETNDINETRLKSAFETSRRSRQEDWRMDARIPSMGEPICGIQDIRNPCWQ